MYHPTFSVPITESSQVGEARRAAATLATTAGMDETGRGRVALVVTEAANNLIQHAVGGEIVLQIVAPDGDDSKATLDILILDRGPGIRDIERAMSDGFSTGGTRGEGLGAILRQADVFDIYSALGQGTAIFARFYLHSTHRSDLERVEPAEQIDVGVVSLPKSGETACGDSWAVDKARDGSLRLLVADGLGHGPDAATASREAVRVFRSLPSETTPIRLLEAAHGALRPTRGAAVAFAVVDPAADSLRFGGIGNIAAAVATHTECRQLTSYNGIVGHQAPRFHEFTYPVPPGATLLMASDGITTQWRIDRYPGLIGRHPALMAGILYRDYSRGRDDVTVLAVRLPQKRNYEAAAEGERE